MVSEGDDSTGERHVCRGYGIVTQVSSIPVATNVVDFDLEMLALPDVAERLGQPITKVRQLLREGKLIAVRQNDVLMVPALFLDKDEQERRGRANENIVKGLPGTITLLSDAGFNLDEIFRWLFTQDASLPGSPIEALRTDRGREVKRRAQALAL